MWWGGFTFAGAPTAVAPFGTLDSTTLFAPILAFSPMVIFPKILEPAPKIAPFLTVGWRFPWQGLPVAPSVTPW